jgi:hypothetical protein
MSSGMRGWILILALTMAACGSESNTAAAGQAEPGYALPAAYKAGERGVLRVRIDGARGRLWVLGIDDVRVYDIVTKRQLRRIVLPNWDVARFICDPDLVLDAAGSAIISSNVRSKLWRIDADDFELKEREIRLDGREQWDIGFGGLMLAADGNLLALSSTRGWLWKIDLDAGIAHLWNWGVPMSNVCDLTPIE